MDFSQLQVLFEDNHLIAVNKPAGVLVQADETGDTPLVEYVKQYIKMRYDKPGDVFLGVVHRLDRPVSGVVIFARTTKALVRMNELFATRAITKTYWAVTIERPDPLEATLTHYLLKDHSRNVTKAYDEPRPKLGAIKPSMLDYELVAELGSNFMLKVQPTTGRSHQIRAQLARIGCIIRGDLKYGAANPTEDQSIMLHARQLEFVHPIKLTDVSITARVPKRLPLWAEIEASQQ